MDHDVEVPPSDSVLSGAVRRGVLLKLSGRGWFFSGCWKKRFCVLTPHARLYFYDKEHSSGRDKSCGVIHFDYHDVCEEDPKKPLAFSLDSSVKAFFENRHQFCAETTEELEGWVSSIRTAIEEARLNRKRRTQEAMPEGTPECLVNANKERVRGPLGRRPPQRKSMMPASRSEQLESDSRQRSVSLSSAQRDEPTEGKWLSLSMEEVEQGKGPSGAQRSSSAADIPLQEGGAPKKSNLLDRHAALTKELEMRLKVGPGVRSPYREVEEASDEKDPEDILRQVKVALQELEEMKSSMRRIMEEAEQMGAEHREQADHMRAENQKQAEQMRAEHRKLAEQMRAELLEAKLEIQELQRNCREMMLAKQSAE